MSKPLGSDAALRADRIIRCEPAAPQHRPPATPRHKYMSDAGCDPKWEPAPQTDIKFNWHTFERLRQLIDVSEQVVLAAAEAWAGFRTITPAK